MALDDAGLRDLAAQGAAAGGLGMLGRMIALASTTRRPSGWSLLWEVPLAIGMGVVGKGLADWLDLSGFPNYALTIAVSYVGPRALDIALDRYAAGKSLKA